MDNLNGNCNSAKTLAFLVPTISQIEKEEIRFDPFPLSLRLAKYSHFPANSDKIFDPRPPTFIRQVSLRLFYERNNDRGLQLTGLSRGGGVFFRLPRD